MEQTIIDILNSPAVSVAIASFVIYLLNRLYAKKPAWKKYEGTVIGAIKFAEKTIPDNAENKSIKRLDAALKYALTIIEDREQRITTAQEKIDIAEGIQIVHDRLES